MTFGWLGSPLYNFLRQYLSTHLQAKLTKSTSAQLFLHQRKKCTVNKELVNSCFSNSVSLRQFLLIGIVAGVKMVKSIKITIWRQIQIFIQLVST